MFTRAQWTSFLGCHHEKVRRAVRALVAQGVAVEEDPPGIDGIGRVCRIHARRIYRGAAGNLRRYFPLRLPVALDARRAVFVYLDPGHETATALRSWGAAHREPWKALWDRGCGIEVVAVVRTVRELQRALTILENWTKTSTASGPSAAPEPDSAARREIVRIEQAIRAKDERVLKEYGDLQAFLKRIVELKDLHRSSSPGTMIHGFATWRSRRLPGGGF